MNPSNDDKSAASCRRGRCMMMLSAAAIICAVNATVSEAAIEPRSILETFFEPGDKPTSSQFAAVIDSMLNKIEDGSLLGLRTSSSGQALLLDAGVSIDSSMLFGPAAGLDGSWAGKSGFMGVAFSENSQTHFGYFQLSAGAPGSPDLYPMFVQAFVYEDVAGMAITTATVPTPEPSTLALAALGFLGVAAWRWRRRKR